MQHVPAHESVDHAAQPRSNSTPRPLNTAAVASHVPYRAVGGPLRCPGAQPRPAAADERATTGRLQRLMHATFINYDFVRLWWGQAISSVGDYAWDAALILWIASQLTASHSWSPLAVSGVVLSAALPQVAVGPLAGVFVDRWNKRNTMVVAAVLQAIFAAALMPVASAARLPLIGQAHLPIAWQLAVIYADVAILSTLAQFFTPAEFTLVKDIVPEAQQDQALEATQAIQGLSVIIGPPVAAALVFGVGLQWALLLNALSFVFVFLTVRAIHAPSAAHSFAPGETSHFSREFLDGLGYVTGRVVLRTILVSELLTWLGFGALQTLGYFFITGNLHASAGDYGFFGAVFGLGAVAGALVVTFFGQRIGLVRLLWSALATSGLFVIVMSHLTSLIPALVAAFLFGVSTSAILVAAGPLALHGTAREYVGRVTAVINPLGRLAALVSIVVTGYMVSTILRGFHAQVLGISFGPVDTVFTGMGLIAMAGGIYARVSLRGLLNARGSTMRSSSSALPD